MKTKDVVRLFVMAGMVAAGSRVAAQTTGNFTWKGEGATKHWNVAGNWVADTVPAVHHDGRVTFPLAAHNTTSIVEANRGVRELYVGQTSQTVTHTIDLGDETLTVTNMLYTYSGGNLFTTLNLTNGTVELGAPGSAAEIYIRQGGIDFSHDDVKLETTNLGKISIIDQGAGDGTLDLRGTEIVGGVFRVDELFLTGRNSGIFIDPDTLIDEIHVTSSIVVEPRANWIYIGNPADTFTMAGEAVGRLPAGINLRFGVDENDRAVMRLCEDVGRNRRLRAAIAVAAGGGGTFTGYFSTMLIAGGERAGITAYGILDVAEMDSCYLDTEKLSIAPGRANAVPTDDERGELRLPTGTVLADEVVIGAVDGAGFGKLELNDTLFTVSESITINATADITINVGDDPKGFDIAGDFIDAEGKIHVNFNTQPTEDIHWAIRIVGDAVLDLYAMIGTGRLTRDIDAGITGRKSGVVTNGNYTYFALVDESIVFDPVAIAQDVTFEMEPGGVVLVAPSEVNGGSFDPEDPEGDTVELKLSYDGETDLLDVLEFNALGDYTVTLTVNILDNGTVTATATDTATVTIVAPPTGAGDGVLVWSGEGPTELMDRREWFWSGNWRDGVPPANPTDATIRYLTEGQNVTGVVDADRSVSTVYAGLSGHTINHTIDLGDKTLTVKDLLRAGPDATQHTTLNFENGTVELGVAGSAAEIYIQQGGIDCSHGDVKLETTNLGKISIIDRGGGSGSLDLSGTEIVGGVFRVDELFLTARNSGIFIDTDTLIDEIHVTSSIVVEPRGNSIYIGNPADTFTMDGEAVGRLPAGISLRFGVDENDRAVMRLCEDIGRNRRLRAAIAVAAGGGGTFTGYFSTMLIAGGERAGVTAYGILDVAGMDACYLDALELLIAPGRVNAAATDDERGELRLPPGTATIGTATIGATDGVGWGLLSLSNTVFTVTNSLALNKTAQIVIDVGDTSSGLDLTSADPGALTLDPGVALTVRFHAPPAGSSVHYGLRLTGDHVAALNAMPSLLVDSSGLPRPAEIFHSQGATYIGMPPPPGSLILLR